MTKATIQILAMVCMLLDHLSVLIFPEAAILRIIGRLAFPIFAYCITEGLTYTRDKQKYLQRVLLCALSFQVVSLVFTQAFVPSVVWGYAAAVGFALLRDRLPKHSPVLLLYSIGVSAVLLLLKAEFLCFGYLLPVTFYLPKKKWMRFTMAGLQLLFLGLLYQHQLWALAALPILMAYNEQRGKLKIGKFLYWFYPLHYLVLGLLSLLI